MIYYDSHKNKLITIDKKDIEAKFITNNNITTKRLSKEGELVIRFDYTEFSYFKKWFNDIHDINGRMAYAAEYKRDIFISDTDSGIDTKFCNCFISSMQLYDFASPCNSVINQFEVSLKCDYYEKGGFYPELKAIYRDKKIDLILSK